MEAVEEACHKAEKFISCPMRGSLLRSGAGRLKKPGWGQEPGNPPEVGGGWKKQKKGGEMGKVYWASRHKLSPAQTKAIKDLHGEDVEIIHETPNFEDEYGLARYIIARRDGFVYAVAGAAHYLFAALAGLHFGIFENHPQKRLDGTFGLSAVYHVGARRIEKVWVNPDPDRDEGEPLIPVRR